MIYYLADFLSYIMMCAYIVISKEGNIHLSHRGYMRGYIEVMGPEDALRLISICHVIKTYPLKVNYILHFSSSFLHSIRILSSFLT